MDSCLLYRKSFKENYMTQSRLDEQFEKMRAVLQKDGVDQSIIQKMINEIVKKRAEEPAPKIAIIGQSGVGKSSTINALFNAGLPVSPSRPCTHDADAREYSLSTGKKITVYDMPGIGESISADRRIIEVYKKVYPKVDVIMWVIAAGDRQLAMMQHILLQIAREAGARGLQQLLFAINKHFDCPLCHVFFWSEAGNVFIFPGPFGTNKTRCDL